MNDLNYKAIRQMGATCVALQHLLSGDRAIDDLHIFAATSFTDAYNAQISRAVKDGHSSLFVTFRCDGSEALIDKLYFFKVSAKENTLEMSFCRFVKSRDGKFALRLAGRRHPMETIYSRSSNRLVTTNPEMAKNTSTPRKPPGSPTSK